MAFQVISHVLIIESAKTILKTILGNVYTSNIVLMRYNYLVISTEFAKIETC